jgi:tetratricopeptide (TPR) repeat protein
VARIFSRITLLLMLGVLAVAALLSLRLAIADRAFRQGTPASVARALALLPGNTAYLAFRALQLEYDNEDPRPLLEQAARLNPLASAPRIRLGLAAETRGDAATAERWLLEAARVDRQFEPRWTLANFYFRQGKRDAFWQWMRAALEHSYGDRYPPFELCWRAAGSPEQILQRAIPDNRDVMAAYLRYLMGKHHEAVGPAALRLAAMRAPADADLLDAACDLLIEAGNRADAVTLWRQVRPDSQGLLANGDFPRPPVHHGFDWRVTEQPGVQHALLNTGPGHRIELSGKQAEACELLRHYVVLEPGKAYRLGWEMRTRNVTTPTGIEWSAGGQTAEVASSEDWRAASVAFTPTAALLPVTLRYRRPTGQPRVKGTLEIRNVTLVATGR